MAKKLSVTDRPTNRPTDRQSGLQSRVHATKNREKGVNGESKTVGQVDKPTIQVAKVTKIPDRPNRGCTCYKNRLVEVNVETLD